MHDTAMSFGKLFFETYAPNGEGLRIADIGSQDVTGSLRDVAPPNCDYIGVDFVEGKGVDVILTDPYSLPFADSSLDICLSSSCFEHSEFFWLLFEEIMRVLKPGGLFYLNAPSNGAFHRFPVDCWRFYPDSGIALQNWGRRQGLDVTLLESFTGRKRLNVWNDFVAVFVKGDGEFPNRMQDRATYDNGRRGGTEEITRYAEFPEGERGLLRLVARRIKRRIERLAAS